MKFKIFLILAILFVTTQRVKLLNLFSCGCDDWEDGVTDSCNGVERVLNKFPEPTFDYGQTILASFNANIQSLKNMTNSTAPLLSSRSIEILKALSLLSKVDNSPKYLLYQFKRVLPQKTSAYCNIAGNITNIIGKLDKHINYVIKDVENSLITCLEQYEKRYTQRKQDRSEKIDFKKMVNSSRLNTNTIAFIADTAVNNGDKLADEVFQAIVIVTFISNLQLLAVHGTNANIGSVLVSETTNISPLLHLCFKALNPLVNDITKLLSSASFDSVAKIKEYLKNYVKTIYSYNEPLAELLGSFKGVNVTEAEVKDYLATKKSMKQ